MTPIRLWQRSGLRHRLHLLAAALLLGTVLLSCWALMRYAESAVQREVDAGFRATQRQLELVLPWLQTQAPSVRQARLQALLTAHAESRHVCLRLEDGPPCVAAGATAPAWFVRHVALRVEHRAYRVGPESPALVLTTDPRHELAEVWQELRGLVGLMLAFTALLLAGFGSLLASQLRPLEAAVARLQKLQRGDLSSDSGLDLPRAAPEIRSLLESVATLQERLLEARRRVADHRRQTLAVQEQERRWLARELHDEIAQQIAAIEFETAALATQAPAPLQAGLARISASTREAHDICRRLLRRLRPETLETLGLHAALGGLVDAWQHRGVSWHLDCRLDPTLDDLPEERSIHVYRIVQEALSNVARHARARHLELDIARVGEVFQLQLRDDGIGLQAAEQGHGLLGLAERVDVLQGRWSLQAGPQGRGCQLSVVWPVEDRGETDTVAVSAFVHAGGTAA